MFLSAVSELRKLSAGNLLKHVKFQIIAANAAQTVKFFLHNADFLALTFSKTPANAGKNI